MKKRVLIITGILFCIGFHRSVAQETPDNIVPGTYYQDNIITNYVGTWKWTSGSDEFTIVLVKKKCVLDTYSVDVLSGGYRYVKNGVEQVNTLNDVNIDINAPSGPMASMESYVREGNRIGFSFIDRLKGDQFCHVSAVITPMGNTYSMTWKLSGTGIRIREPNDPPFPQGFSVPMNMVLVKQ